MLNKLRPQLQRLVNPLASKIRLHPNILTIIGLLVSLLAAYAFSQKNLLAGALLILLSGFFDVIDGAVARNNNTKSKFGGLLDYLRPFCRCFHNHWNHIRRICKLVLGNPGTHSRIQC